MDSYIFSGAFALFGAVIFFAGFKKMRKYRIIKDTPRSKIRSMAMGIVEIHGNVVSDETIKSPFSKTDCVYYRYEIQEYKRRTTRSGGKTKTTTEWVTVAHGDKRIPFFAKDDTGQVLVEPEGAEFNVDFRRGFYQSRGGLFASSGTFSGMIKALKSWDGIDTATIDSENWGLQPMQGKSSGRWFSKVGDRKYFEYFIAPDDILFVLGTAANSPDAPNNVLIRQGANEKTFLISDKSEENTLRSIRKNMIVCFVFGGLFFVAGVMVTLHIAEVF